MTEDDIERLLLDERIVRHRAKIKAIIANAQAYINYEKQNSQNSFSHFVWQFTNHQQIQQKVAVTSTEASCRLAKELKRLGFKFIGDKTAYAFMQAIGMYNSHERQCERSVTRCQF